MVADVMQRECDRLSASEGFSRAPVMRRLLQYLVAETLAGRGASLKAYTVAVEGLARAPDFDAQADSYPRVQVGRLRRLIDSFYDRFPPQPGQMRLTIPNGAYEVVLIPNVPAVPSLARDGDEIDGMPGELATPGTDMSSALPLLDAVTGDATRSLRRRVSGKLLLGLALAIGLFAAFILGIWFSHQKSQPLDAVLSSPPLIAIAATTAAKASPDGMANNIDRVLVDALGRFWLAEVGAADARNPDFRLQPELGGRAGNRLYLTLWDSRTENDFGRLKCRWEIPMNYWPISWRPQLDG